MERATIAVDVYSLGVMAYEALAGQLPFSGPTINDFREQHLHSDPPHLSGVDSHLASLIAACLYKAPGARPAPRELAASLRRITAPPRIVGLDKLRSVHEMEARRRGEESRRDSEARSVAEHRAGLIETARRTHVLIATQLREAIADAAPSCHFKDNPAPGKGWSASIGKGNLKCGPLNPADNRAWGNRRPPVFDVVAYSEIRVAQPANQSGYEGRGHALWFCDAREAGRFRWFETAFMGSPLMQRSYNPDPFALKPSEEAARAIGSGLDIFQVAWPFTEISEHNLDEFIRRWADWFAEAAQGLLHHPSAMPERDPSNSWRTR